MRYIGKLKQYTKELILKLKSEDFYFPYEHRNVSDSLKCYFSVDSLDQITKNSQYIDSYHEEPTKVSTAVIMDLKENDVTPDLTSYWAQIIKSLNYPLWRKDLSGSGIKVCIIDGNCNFLHEDLIWKHVGFINGPMIDGDSYTDHGTEVLGILAAQNNKFGINGLCQDAEISFASTYNLLDSLLTAGDKLSKGDVIFFECALQFNNEHVPVEYADYVYDGIKYCIDKGIIVIEPVGNTNTDLDDLKFGRKFDRNFRDSGAIFVAAAYIKDDYIGPSGITSYGSRVDICCPGVDITTCGRGDLVNSTNKNRWYTSSFGGTSVAGAFAGAIATNISSARKSLGREPLNSLEMRNILYVNGKNANTKLPNILVGKFTDVKESLKVAAPIPDLDADGVVTLQDFWIFQEYWSDSDLRGDFNDDKAVNINDFFTFVTSFGKTY